MQPNNSSGVATGPPPSASRRLQLGNWRVSRRLIALVLIPTVFATVLVGLRVYNSVSSANAYSKVEHLGRMSGAITALAQELMTERDLTAGYIAAGRPADRKDSLQAQYTKADAAVDDVRTLAAAVDRSYGIAQVNGARTVLNRLDDISALRQTATGSRVPAGTVIDEYAQNIAELVSVLDGATSGVADDTLSRDARALGALARLKEEASRQRAYYLVGLIEGSLDPADLTAAVSARAQEDSELALFQLAASPDQRHLYDDTVIGPDVDRADVLRIQILSETTALRGARHIGLASPENADAWMKAMTATLDRMRIVEQRVGDNLVTRAHSEQRAALRSAIISGAIAAILLLLVLLVTFVVARSLVRPLRRLRSSALDVAGTQLPGLVERLRDPDAAAAGIQIQPVDVNTSDEIGDVARAFDEVHREAARLAANEAVLRGNINAMFVNLSRRSQSLIERQLRLIDELEQGERDDERLAALFRLDHLATRMRRNCENLLVLGGQDQVRRWNRPVPLLDVVRASLSEVEQYERVQLRIQGEVSIAGPVVNDLVHLVAELVENAISFSPEHTPITVSGHLVSGGSIMLQITDEGVGMTPEELAAVNQRLAAPPMADVSAARRMGLFVVGRLAARHNIRVELRPTVSGGVTAFALLPDRIVAAGEERGLPVGAGAQAPAANSWSAFSPAAGSPAIPPPREAQRPGQLSQPIWRTAQDAVPAPPASPPPMPRTAPIARDLRRDPMLRPAIETPMATPAPLSNDFRGMEPGPLEPMHYTEPKPLPRRPVSYSDPVGDTGPMPPIQDVRPAIPPNASTGPMPAIPAPPVAPPPPPTPAGPASSGPWGPIPAGGGGNGRRAERSPIFEAMTSEWFQARPPENISELPDPKAWRSVADEGWQTADVKTTQPTAGGRTVAGLPKRVPGQNRVPGAIPQSSGPGQPEPMSAQPASPLPPPRELAREVARPPADVVRARFSGLQRGIHRGRSETTSGAWAQAADDSGTDSSETGERT